jgi:uncharacterized membrane protein YkoI
MEVYMIRRTWVLVAFVWATFMGAHVAWSEEAADQAALIKALDGAKVTLQQGLATSQREGRATSGKFEMEDGKLRLSVYTTKAGKYFEVIVDYATGKIAKAEPITQGEDLDHAKSQTAAMAKAKTTLKSAVDKAVKTVPGSRAVSVTPDLKDGHSTASIQLLKGGQLQTVTQKLD